MRDRPTAWAVCACQRVRRSTLRFRTRTCAREGEQAAGQCACTSACRSGCAQGAAARGCASACQHQTPLPAPGTGGEEAIGLPGRCGGDRGRRRAGLSLERGLGSWGGVWEGAERCVGHLHGAAGARCPLPGAGSSTGQTGTTSAWPTWMAATALCSLPTRRDLLVRIPCAPHTTLPCGTLAGPESPKRPLRQPWLPGGLAAGLCCVTLTSCAPSLHLPVCSASPIPPPKW